MINMLILVDGQLNQPKRITCYMLLNQSLKVSCLPKHLSVIVTLLLSFTAFGQVNFDDGSIIKNDETKLTGKIRWAKYPEFNNEIEFRVNIGDKSTFLHASEIKSFVIDKGGKYVSADIRLIKAKHPRRDIFASDTLPSQFVFLRQIVDGKKISLFILDIPDDQQYFFILDTHVPKGYIQLIDWHFYGDEYGHVWESHRLPVFLNSSRSWTDLDEPYGRPEPLLTAGTREPIEYEGYKKVLAKYFSPGKDYDALMRNIGCDEHNITYFVNIINGSGNYTIISKPPRESSDYRNSFVLLVSPSFSHHSNWDYTYPFENPWGTWHFQIFFGGGYDYSLSNIWSIMAGRTTGHFSEATFSIPEDNSGVLDRFRQKNIILTQEIKWHSDRTNKPLWTSYGIALSYQDTKYRYLESKGGQSSFDPTMDVNQKCIQLQFITEVIYRDFEASVKIPLFPLKAKDYDVFRPSIFSLNLGYHFFSKAKH